MRKIYNLDVQYADNILSQARGLMFRKSFSKALWFRMGEKSKVMTSIHSFFVFFPFDIIWLDGKKIVDLQERVKPWTLNITPKKAADSFIELPAGTIRKKKIKTGKYI
jgi:hypothetical protein